MNLALLPLGVPVNWVAQPLEGRMEVDGSMIDKRLSNPALSLWAERVLLLCKIDPTLLSEEDVSFTYRYLLAWLTLDNSQRPGPAINMTVREFEDRTQRENKCVIFVEKHKTAMAGSAKVVADNERVTTLMECWYNSIRPRLSGEADTFLIKGNGQPISSNMAAREIERLGEMVCLWLPTPKMGRKLTSTKAGDAGEEVERLTAEHMSHSVGTSRSNYQGVCSARPDNVTPPPSPPKSPLR